MERRVREGGREGEGDFFHLSVIFCSIFAVVSSLWMFQNFLVRYLFSVFFLRLLMKWRFEDRICKQMEAIKKVCTLTASVSSLLS